MKQTILGVLTAALLLSLCACGGQSAASPEHTDKPEPAPGTTASSDPDSTAPVTAAPEPTPEPTPEPYYPDVASPSDLYIPEMRSKSAETSLAELRKRMEGAGADCAIAYLGHANPGMSLAEFLGCYDLLQDSKIGEAFPFLKEMTPANCVAEVWSDLFCLVPVSTDVRVVIEQVEMDEEAEPTDEVAAVLYDSSNGEPVFFTSESNGWGGSNVRVRITTADGSENDFWAAMWCNLGTVCEAERVLDFSIYDAALDAE